MVHNLAQAVTHFSHYVLTTGKDGAIAQENMDNTTVYRCRAYGEVASMPVSPSLVTRVIDNANEYDLIAIHYPFPLAEFALLFTPFTPPIVVHWHSEVIAQKKLKWIVAPLTFVMLWRAKSIVVTSEKMLASSFFLQRFKRKITFIPYGLSSAPPNATSSTKKVDDYFIIIGRHVSYKGIDVAIRAIKNTNIKLIICGHGPLFEKNKKLAKDLGLTEQIIFKPYSADDEITALLHQARALVVPSVLENEAFALVQIEAMRLGKAVINTQLRSSVPWVARDQQEAITVPPNNVMALTSALQQLANDDSLCQRLGDNALQRYHSHFSLREFSAKIDALYRSLISNTH